MFGGGEKRDVTSRPQSPNVVAQQDTMMRSLWTWESGAPEKIRTPNPQIRSLVLYPVELRAP